MSKINHIITSQAFELVRDRIAEILADEIDNQFIRSYDPDLDLSGVWLERTSPFDKTEMNAINISLSTGSFGNKNQGSVDGTYIYNIDGYTNSKTIGAEGGDKLAALKLHKILGICRAILEDSIYKTLGFSAPFISRVFYNDLKIAQRDDEKDALSSMMGRLTFTVVVNEKTLPITPVLIDGYQTKIKLNISELGYFYKTGN